MILRYTRKTTSSRINFYTIVIVNPKNILRVSGSNATIEYTFKYIPYTKAILDSEIQDIIDIGYAMVEKNEKFNGSLLHTYFCKLESFRKNLISENKRGDEHTVGSYIHHLLFYGFLRKDQMKNMNELYKKNK